MSEQTKSYNKLKYGIVKGILSTAIGLGIGVAVESHTDNVAAKKVTTVETCEKLYPLQGAVSKEFHDCTTKGVPGGTWIGKNRLPVGVPEAYVEAYVEAQQHQASNIDIGAIAVWGIAGAAFEFADLL